MKKLSSLSLVCIAVLSLVVCGKNLSADELVNNASAAVAQGDHLPTLMKQSALYAEEGNEEAMLEGLQRAIELYPDEIEPRLVLSRYYVLRGQPDLAIGLFSEQDASVRFQPAVAQLLARAELAQQNYPVARQYLERLIEQQPDVAGYHYQLAMTYAGEGDSGKTRAELEKTIELDRDHFPAHVALARLLLLNQDLPGLEAQMVHLRRIAPANADVLQLEGALAKLRRDSGAALESDVHSVIALNNEAWQLRQSDPAKALSYAEAAAELEPNNARVIDTLAVVLLANKKLDRAQRTIDRAIALDPGNPSQQFHAAQITYASGDTKGALAILKPLLETGVSFPEQDDAIQLLSELER